MIEPGATGDVVGLALSACAYAALGAVTRPVFGGEALIGRSASLSGSIDRSRTEAVADALGSLRRMRSPPL